MTVEISDPPGAMERFMAKVDKTDDGCWNWTAGKHAGYGMFYYQFKMWRAHRWAYTHLVSAIPDGMVIDHLCSNKGCVNPTHLEPVWQQTNSVRYYDRRNRRLMKEAGLL